jgi:L-threonylcarbamoyladenylate synthase
MSLIQTITRTGGREEDIADAAACLARGGLVAFPTETVYGLGADALNPEAVERVFSVKGRPADNPLIVHVRNMEVAERFAAVIPEKARRLADLIWPGPLTIVVERNDIVPDVVAAGLDTVAIRVPRHPMTLRLLDLFDGGIVGPSANVSGRPSPTTVEDVLEDLSGRIEMVLDGGPTQFGVESTVVDFAIDPPVILRRGALGCEEIETHIGALGSSTADLVRRSPGTRHRHYAPTAIVIIVPEGDAGGLARAIAHGVQGRGIVSVLTHSRELNALDLGDVPRIAVDGAEGLARELYHRFREFDRSGSSRIVVEGVAEHGIGAALMDRLRRAAEGPHRTI